MPANSWWRTRLGAARRGRKATVRKSEQRSAGQAFAQVVITPAGGAARTQSSQGAIEVVAPNGLSVRIQGPFEASTLRDVLKVVRSC